MIKKRNHGKFTWQDGDIEILPSNDVGDDETEDEEEEPTEPSKAYLEAVRRRRDLTGRSKGA